jgi:hypothetical protein
MLMVRKGRGGRIKDEEVERKEEQDEEIWIQGGSGKNNTRYR